MFLRRAVLLLSAAFSVVAAQPPLHTRNVIFVMTDGFRWQEVFQGADAALMNEADGHVSNLDQLKRLY